MKLPPTARGARTDRAVAELLRAEGRDVSLREVRRALERGQIRLDGRPRPPGATVQGDEAVDLDGFVPRAEARLDPDPGLLARAPILFEDQTLLVLAKPSGVPTQPLRPGETGTLLNAAVAHAPEIAEAGPPLEGGLVHRLDVGTSGVVMFAKDEATREALRTALSRHAIEKVYLALVEVRAGLPAQQRIAKAIASTGGERVRVADAPEGPAQQAYTEVTVEARYVDGAGGRYAWVRARTRFGRRHQVRVHLESVGAPIVGDPVYGRGPTPWLDRLALHAAQVLLPSGQIFEAPVPEALQEALAGLCPDGAAP